MPFFFLSVFFVYALSFEAHTIIIPSKLRFISQSVFVTFFQFSFDKSDRQLICFVRNDKNSRISSNGSNSLMDSVRSHPFYFVSCDCNFNHQMENLTPYTISMGIEYIVAVDSIFLRLRERGFTNSFYFSFRVCVLVDYVMILAMNAALAICIRPPFDV